MIISRYLTKEVLSAFFATTLLLLLVFISTQLLSYMKSAAYGKISLHAVLLLLSLQIPVLLTFLIPLSLFLGILLAFGRLYTDSEMTVLFACGVSIKALLLVVFRIAVFVSIGAALLSLYVAPKMEEYSAHVVEASKEDALGLLTYGKFNSVLNDKWFFYVEGAAADHKSLKNVFAAEKAGGVIFSKGGYQHIDAEGNKFLVLTNGYRYSGFPGRRDYKIIKFGEYGIKFSQEKKTLNFEENMLPTKTLWQNRDKPEFAAELHWRIALVIAVLVLTLLAVPLSKVTPRYGRYFSLVPAGFCYILYANLMVLGRIWITKGTFLLAFGMWWVHVVMLSLGILLIWHQNSKFKIQKSKLF